jgi:BMFP domain-containing protein YqiC
MQTRNPIFDEFAKLATGAAGLAQGMGEEARAIWRAQVERIIADMDMVRRDEFDAVKELAASSRREVDALKARLEALEAGQISQAKVTPKTAPSRKKTVNP